MRAADRTDYIVRCMIDAAAMYEDDAKTFLAEHDADVRAEALREAADAVAENLRDTPEYGQYIADLLRGMADAGQAGTVAAPSGETTQPEPDYDLIRCSHIHCPNAERFAKAPERGWQHGHMDTWLCPQHRTEPERVQCTHGRYAPHTCPACQIGTRA